MADRVLMAMGTLIRAALGVPEGLLEALGHTSTTGRSPLIERWSEQPQVRRPVEQVARVTG